MEARNLSLEASSRQSGRRETKGEGEGAEAGPAAAQAWGTAAMARGAGMAAALHSPPKARAQAADRQHPAGSCRQSLAGKLTCCSAARMN